MKVQFPTWEKKSKAKSMWTVRNLQIPLDRPLIMGVLNITPDSFSDGGNFIDPEKAYGHALKMIEEGADILDIGAESTRPGAKPVSAEEEISRILPVLDQIVKASPLPISIDTTKPEVARVCLDHGAHMINDVSGLKDSKEAMAKVVCQHRAGLILMHRRGTPENMHLFTDYAHLIDDVLQELKTSIEYGLAQGLAPEQIAIDPGLGFSKNPEQNLEILQHLEKFIALGYPVVLGPSRKSFLGKITQRPVHEREFATAACVTAAVLKGVHVLRVHDVRMMKDVADVADAILNINTSSLPNT